MTQPAFGIRTALWVTRVVAARAESAASLSLSFLEAIVLIRQNCRGDELHSSTLACCPATTRSTDVSSFPC